MNNGLKKKKNKQLKQEKEIKNGGAKRIVEWLCFCQVLWKEEGEFGNENYPRERKRKKNGKILEKSGRKNLEKI